MGHHGGFPTSSVKQLVMPSSDQPTTRPVPRGRVEPTGGVRGLFEALAGYSEAWEDGWELLETPRLDLLTLKALFLKSKSSQTGGSEFGTGPMVGLGLGFESEVVGVGVG